VSITVAQIVANPSLRTIFLAGENGGERTVDWAHNTDVNEPWNWLSAGELLMTLGRNFPSTPTDQIAFIENLANAGVAGLDVAAGWYAPELTQDAKKYADEISFPIIQTAYEIPFVLISRTVAEATSKTNQLSKILQMYEFYRQSSLRRESAEEQLQALEKHVSMELTIFDTKSLRSVLPFERKFPENLLNQINSALQKSPLPAVYRLKDLDNNYLLISLGSPDQILVVKPNSDNVDLVALQHTASVVAFIAERFARDASTRATTGKRLLTQLLENLVDRELAKERLEQFGLEKGPWQVACPHGNLTIDLEYIHTVFDRKKIPAIATTGNSGLIVLTKSDFVWTEDFLNVLVGTNSTVGLSSQINSLSRLADGAREANWARESTLAQGIRIGTYGETDSLFLPRTVAAAEVAVNSILSPLMKHDQEHSGELIKSLETFFNLGMSWQKASQELGIHRQTLNYRMQKVAELTNRNVNDLQQLTELYLAIKAKNMLDRT